MGRLLHDLRLHFKSRTTTKASDPAIVNKDHASNDTQTEKNFTYRVRGVPLEWSRTELEQFLATYGEPSAEGVEVKSLAVDIDGKQQISTVDCPRNVQLPPTTSGTLEASSGSSPANLGCDRHFHGLTTLFCPPEQDHFVDIVAVCGLGGHAFGSFKNKKDGYMWLRDSLGESVCADDSGKPMARVMTYGYDSKLHESSSFQHIGHLATALHQHLSTVKVKKPLVFVGHSLGGLIIKEEALGGSTSADHQMLLQRFYGFAFFGVPNAGMDIESLLPMVGKGPNLGMLTGICRHSSHILDTQRRLFGPALTKMKSEVFCCYETEESATAKQVDGRWQMSGPKAVLVAKQSATYYKEGERDLENVLPIPATHSDLIKLERNHDGVIKAKLSDVCHRAVQSLAQNASRVKVSKEALERRKRLMKHLRFPQMDARLSTVKHTHANTYEWVLENPTFRQWQNPDPIPEEHRMVWIKGNPGAGKSTVMKFTYNRIRASLGKTTFVTSFFFNARGDELEKTLLGMYRSLVWHLLDQFPDLQAVFDDTSLLARSRETCSVVELQDLLRAAVLRLGNRSVIWFIDALDECQRKELAEMVHYFEALVACTLDQHINLGICFSSRHFPAIDIQRAQELILDRNPHHAEDLKTYITSRLRVKNIDVVERVLAKASGVFLWVVLVVDILNEEYLDGRIALKRIDEVPADLNHLFKQLLGRTDDAVKDETTKLSMLWLLFSEEPLEAIEYRSAICGGLSSKGLISDEDFPPDETMESLDERYIVSSSKGLAQITTRGKVQLIHESIRDFLLKEHGLVELWPELVRPGSVPKLTLADLPVNVVGECYATLQQSCMGYWRYWRNSAPRFSSDEGFLVHAIDYVLHYAEAAAGTCPQTEFLSNFPLQDYISNMGRRSSKYSLDRGEVDLLYVLSFDGHAKLITAFLQLEDIDQRTAERAGKHQFPALAAAANGHKGAFEALLSSKTDVYVGADLFDEIDHFASRPFRAFSYEGYTPLSWAAGRGYTDMVSKLLDYQQPINEWGGSGTPLSESARNGHEGMARLLIEKGADINAGNPLVRALHEGHEEIARLLIEKGADINADNPLLVALYAGHEGIARLLIEKGADVNADNPLVKALYKGHEGIARLLIEKGADINADNPLAKASFKGHEGIARLLIEKGADINANNPLAKASFMGHEGIARLLIEKRADINADNPLVKALYKGHEEIARLLIEKGADINADNPLVKASFMGHEGIARLLIEKGADINADNPLVKASFMGHEEIARLLIEKGVDSNATDSMGRTPMAHASRLGNNNVVELLLKQDGTTIAIADRFGNTPLDAAVRNGHSDAVEMLLKNGARLRDTSTLANTCLIGWARLICKNDEQNKILQLLRSHTSADNIDLPDDPAPKGYKMVQCDDSKAWCDACTITIAFGANYHVCNTCDEMGLVVCQVCWRRGIRCLDDSHVLGDHIVEEYA